MSLRDVFHRVYSYLLLVYDAIRLWVFPHCLAASLSTSVGLPPVDQSQLQLAHLVDLCLLQKTDALGQRVLPYGIRQLIKDFLFVTLDNSSIRTAVKLWCESREQATNRYGHISLWDTHRVTDTSSLFYDKPSFNDDISGWDVSKVTTLSHMFHTAYAFNQPIGTWNTSNVTDMRC